MPYFAIVAAMILGLAGCAGTASYRYKLTVAVNTPEGVKRTSTVAEVLFQDVSIPANGTMHKLRGEALFLDLGPGARPLIALLTSQLHPKYGTDNQWTGGWGPSANIFQKLYGLKPPTDNVIEYVSRLGSMRGAHSITPNDLPDLVTFADINDPKSVIEVDPNNLQVTLGPNISWNEITLEITDEPITHGIEKKLPWIRGYFEKNLQLDGSDMGFYKHDLANRLSWSDFDQSDDLERSK
ncbi:MAG: hypothetical protein WA268_03640 [Xanthobacteraceae bacterium]